MHRHFQHLHNEKVHPLIIWIIIDIQPLLVNPEKLIHANFMSQNYWNQITKNSFYRQLNNFGHAMGRFLKNRHGWVFPVIWFSSWQMDEFPWKLKWVYWDTSSDGPQLKITKIFKIWSVPWSLRQISIHFSGVKSSRPSIEYPCSKILWGLGES